MRISDWSSDVCSSDLGKAGEDRIEIVLGMTDLVDGKPLVLAQPAAGVECLLLEEAEDLVDGLLEVAVASVHMLARREDAGDARGIEARHQLFGARHEGVDAGRPQNRTRVGEGKGGAVQVDV